MADLAIAEGPILRAILNATYDIWGEGLTPRAYDRYYSAQRATPWGSRSLERLALVDGTEVLASAKHYSLTAVVDGQRLRVAGLGAVFTPPPHRGRGHARDLVTRLLDRAVTQGAELALLFSEIGADYYARLGFEPVPTMLKSLAVVSPTREGAPAMLVRAGDERDLPAIVAIGESRAAPFRFHLDRDRNFVHYALAKKRLLAGLGPPGLREMHFFVAEEGVSAVAYVMLTVHRGDWVLEECGDRDPAGARAGGILQALLARDRSNRPVVRGWLPAGFLPPQITVTDDRPTADVMMVRALSDRAKRALPLCADDVLYWHSDLF